MNKKHKKKVAVLGLGYVGFTLTENLARHFDVVAFDINKARVEELRNLPRRKFHVTDDQSEISDATYYFVAVQTPINNFYQKEPVLTYTNSACEMVSRCLKKGDTVIVESTVFPGYTEEVALPILESHSQLKAGKDFYLGYSPERINPSDTKHTLARVNKIVSGLNSASLKRVSDIYATIVKGDIHEAPNMKVAEAAKLVENIQRDVNVALMNDLTRLFHQMNIKTKDVLEAAATKWNFLPFTPGLVGGHCIGLDPYYLLHKAKEYDYSPTLVREARKVNESMVNYLVEEIKNQLATYKISKPRIGFLGLTFKPNCPDVRNAKALEVIKKLSDLDADILYHDPVADETHIPVEVTKLSNITDCHIIIMAVGHDTYKKMTAKKLKTMLKKPYLVFDFSLTMDETKATKEGIKLWQL